MVFLGATDSKRRLIIVATNISQGGGKTLLRSLLETLPTGFEVLALLDSRMTFAEPTPNNLTKIYFAPTILQRLRAQWWLFFNTKPTDVILCFGGLPPLFRLKGKVFLFIQNRYLIEKRSLSGFPIKTMFRLFFEQARLRLTSKNTNEYIVQSPSMKAALLLSGFVSDQLVDVRPFISSTNDYCRVKSSNAHSNTTKLFDFVYVASGEPHKNHLNLIEAWCLLAKGNLFPSLCLTLDARTSAKLCTMIEERKLSYKLNLQNVGLIPHKQILELYSQSNALIFPSKFESFGLPLIEARQAGLVVVASELDYVRDVLDPEQTFDPNSPVSIERAVKRAMGIVEEPLPLMDGSGFLDSIFLKVAQ